MSSSAKLMVLLVAVLIVISGCADAAAESTELPMLPTLIPSPTPEAHGVDAAHRTAVLFLDAWQRSDYNAMHDLLTFNGQEATPLESFTAAYENAAATMTLDNLSWQGNTLYDDPNSNALLFNYNVTFQTRLLGTFEDYNRDLQLTIDPRAGTWRVAWSPGDIFAELENGGELQLERTLPSRANIYDRTGEVVLADQEGRYVAVSVVKGDIPQPDSCLPLLSQVTLREVEVIQGVLDNAAADWVTEIGVIEPNVWEANRAALEDLCGATFNPYPVRRYATGALTSHIVGYVGYPDEADIPDVLAAGFNQDSILGRTGIEGSWDETLRGRVGARLIISTRGTNQIRELARIAPQPGQSLWLTIDADLQRYGQQIIADDYNNGLISEQSEGAALVMLDVNTGAVLAMVSYPTFDNNAFTAFPMIGRQQAAELVPQVQEDERTPQLNRATLGVYPSGSTMKVVTGTAVVDSGVYDFNTRYTSVGVWDRDIPRTDWLAGGHGTVTVQQAITVSCNTCFYEAGYQMNQVDPYIFPSYARMMGLGVPTGLRDLAEASGTIPDPDWIAENRDIPWSFSDAVNMAIGQGEVEVTPLQMARVAALIANGGIHYRPQMVQQAGILGEAPTYTMEPEVMERIDVDPAVIEMVQTGMCNVTTQQQGTAEFVFRNSPLQEIGVCGKTGTAQATGESAQPHAWFIAYAPRENPEVAIAVLVENTGDGSAFGAPITCRMLEYYFYGEPRSSCAR